MNRAIPPLLAAFLLAALATPGAAQEKVPPPIPEKLPPVPEKLPPVVETPVPHDCAPTCPGVRVLWMERAVPIQVLTPREVIAPQKRPALVVDFREEKRKVIETIIKSREVSCQIPFTTMKPVVETCPTTGECHTVMQPCTEMRTVKELVFYPEPVERIIVVRVPFVKEVEEIVPQRTVLLEYKTEMQACPSAIAVPTTEPVDRFLLTPEPCLHH